MADSCSDCETKQQQVQQLETKYNNAHADYESLKQSYDQIKLEHDTLLKETEQKNLRIEDLIKQYQDYERLKESYNIEVVCRETAEDYASEVTRKNKKLVRQSQAILDCVDVTVPLPDEFEEESTDKYKEELCAQIEDLKGELAELSTNCKLLTVNWEYEKSNNTTKDERISILEHEVQQYKESIQKHLESNDELKQDLYALSEDLEKARSKYAEEMLCKNEAEKFATKLFAQKESYKRESTMLMRKVSPEKQYLEALVAIEDLTENIAQQKQEYEEKIAEIKENLEINQPELENLQEENTKIVEANEKLSSRITDLEEQYKKITEQYSSLEDKYTEAIRPPPPPPPPPLPVSVVNKGGPIGKHAKKKLEAIKKSAPGGGDTNYQAAINEMMQRIQLGGKSLRPTLKSVNKSRSEDEPDSPGNQLRAKFRSRRNKSDGDVLDSIDENSDFSKHLKSLRKISEADSEEADQVPLRRSAIMNQSSENDFNNNETEKGAAPRAQIPLKQQSNVVINGVPKNKSNEGEIMPKSVTKVQEDDKTPTTNTSTGSRSSEGSRETSTSSCTAASSGSRTIDIG